MRTIKQLINRPKSMTKVSPITAKERDLINNELEKLYDNEVPVPNYKKSGRIQFTNRRNWWNRVDALQRAKDLH